MVHDEHRAAGRLAQLGQRPQRSPHLEQILGLGPALAPAPAAQARKAGSITTQTGFSLSTSSVKAIMSKGSPSLGTSGEQTKFSRGVQRQPPFGEIRWAIDLSAGKPDSPDKNSTRPGCVTGKRPKNGVPLASEIMRSAARDVLSVLKGPKIPPN